MLLRCSGVSFTLLAVTEGAWGFTSALGEHPAIKNSIDSSTATRIRIILNLFSRLFGEICPVPPAAAERLEQRGSIGKAAGLSLNQADTALLVSLLSAEQ